jgi:ribosomal protein L7/L12
MNASPEIASVVVLILCAVIVILLVQLRLSEIMKHVSVVSRVEAKLDLLLKQAGIKYDPYKNVPREVAEALSQGKKILAIKRYRAATGVGLKEAKDAVEEIERRAGTSGTMR